MRIALNSDAILASIKLCSLCLFDHEIAGMRMRPRGRSVAESLEEGVVTARLL